MALKVGSEEWFCGALQRKRRGRGEILRGHAYTDGLDDSVAHES